MKSVKRHSWILVFWGCVLTLLLVGFAAGAPFWNFSQHFFDGEGVRRRHLFLLGGGIFCTTLLYMHVWIISLARLWQMIGLNILVLVFSTSATLYLVEGGLTIMAGMRASSSPGNAMLAIVKDAARKAGVPFDSRSASEVIQHFQLEGKNAFPAVSPWDFLYGGFYELPIIHGETVFPLSGISRSTTVLCNETGKWAHYESDEYGFNNPPGLYVPDGVLIAAIGDSYTQGYCVGPNRNAIALLRKTYPKTLNLGVGGNGPLVELATFREYVEPLRPKIVLWLYCPDNDLRKNLEQEKRHQSLVRYLEHDFRQNLVTIQPQIDQSLRDLLNSGQQDAAMTLPDTMRNARFVRFLALPRIRAKISSAYQQLFPQSYIDDQTYQYDLALFEEILSEVNSTVASWGGQFYFVYLPTLGYLKALQHPEDGGWWEYEPQIVASVRALEVTVGEWWENEPQVLALVNQLDIPVINVVDEFLARDDPSALFPFHLYFHYNEDGYRVVADTIQQALEQYEPRLHSDTTY